MKLQLRASCHNELRCLCLKALLVNEQYFSQHRSMGEAEDGQWSSFHQSWQVVILLYCSKDLGQEVSGGRRLCWEEGLLCSKAMEKGEARAGRGVSPCPCNACEWYGVLERARAPLWVNTTSCEIMCHWEFHCAVKSTEENPDFTLKWDKIERAVLWKAMPRGSHQGILASPAGQDVQLSSQNKKCC